jgi:hypothetical protein
MRISTGGNLILETVATGVRVMRFARPNLRPYLDDVADSVMSPLFREVEDTVLSGLPRGWTLVINLGLIDAINAAFYRCLLYIRKCVQACGGRLVLCGLTQWHEEVFDLFRGPEVFTIVSTEAEARRRFRAGRGEPEIPRSLDLTGRQHSRQTSKRGNGGCQDVGTGRTPMSIPSADAGRLFSPPKLA